MENAVWGFIGTAVGGFLTMLSSWTVSRAQHRHELESRHADRLIAEREERKIAYLRLLAICRQLRTLSRPGRSRDVAELDRLGGELSSATYEIDLISGPLTALAAQTLAQAVRVYLHEAKSLPEANAATSDMSVLDEQRVIVRKLVDDFIESARQDLEENARPEWPIRTLASPR